MNQHDSERMAGLLEGAGYARTDDDRDADVIVINTCSVREKAEEKLYTRLGEIRMMGEESGSRPLVAVAGCVAQQEGEKLLDRTNGHVIDVLIGTQSLKMLPMLVSEVRAARSEQREDAARTSNHAPRIDLNPYDDVSFPLGIAKREVSHKAYVTIIEGCNEFCAFCVVPYTRGKERMRPARDIVADVRHAAETGAREVQLLGQIVNHYRSPDEPDCDFAELLSRVNDVEGIERIRFASPHPRHVSSRMIDAIRSLPKVCRHLHLPVQSGSTRLLQAMRRRHTREEYLDLIARLRDALPDLALSTDMIVGFPGETAEDFEQSLSLTAAVRYHSMFSFKYSPRPNTLALKRMPDDVSEEEKTRRIVALQALQREIQTGLNQRLMGRTVDVLVDAASRRRETDLSGRTSTNVVVNLPGPAEWIGRTLPVRVERAGPHSVWGRALVDPASGEDGLTGAPAVPRL